MKKNEEKSDPLDFLEDFSDDENSIPKETDEAEMPQESEQREENKLLSESEKYEMLRNFLLSKKDDFTLRDDIDFWCYDFEFCFECNRITLFNSTKEVKEYFENFGFEVTQVSFRDYTYENSVRPLLKNKKKYKDGKKIYSVRVDKDSKFFEENADNYKNSNFEVLEPPEEEYSKKPVLNKGLICYIIIGIFAFALIFAMLALPHFANNKKNRYSYLDDNLELTKASVKIDSDYFSPRNSLDYDAETLGIPSYEYYNLRFETTEGTKEYQNAKFEIKDNNFIIKIYTKDSDDFFEFQGFEILPKESVKNISGRKISD